MNRRPPVPPRSEIDLFERATTIDDALAEIGTWASSLPGDFAVDASDRDDAITEVTINGVLISSGLR